MLEVQETTDRGVDIASGWVCHCHSDSCLSVAGVCSGFVMNVRGSGFGMGIGRMSSGHRGVGELAMSDARLDTTWQVEYVFQFHPSGGVHGIVVGVLSDDHCVVDEVEGTHYVKAVMRELFSNDSRLEFLPWIVHATELPAWDQSLAPADLEICLIGWPTLLLIRLTGKSSNIGHNHTRVRVRALGWHSTIWMVEIERGGMSSTGLQCDGRHGGLLLE
jgi:hypothetical protein